MACYTKAFLKLKGVTPMRSLPFRNSKSKRERVGFTLIELLVVMGIIGILAGLLLPALSRARERGRSANCISNLKQIGVGMLMYANDSECYPPGRWEGTTQWDLCVGVYAGGKSDPLLPEARSRVFMCPSVRISNTGTRLNYSANPNVCKEITATAGPVRANQLHRTTEIIVAGDAIQYSEDGMTHVILWGVTGSSSKAIYWNDGDPARAGSPIQIGCDSDRVFDVSDATGSNFRYRHGTGGINALLADGHVRRFNKGKVVDQNLYTNY